MPYLLLILQQGANEAESVVHKNCSEYNNYHGHELLYRFITSKNNFENFPFISLFSVRMVTEAVSTSTGR